jgi:hypothetical protein
LNCYAVIATHHKTGSVWMRTVFRSISRKLGIPYINVSSGAGALSKQTPHPAIIYSDHSDFSQCRWLIKNRNSRILHLIRDPRDVIISAMQYHRKSTEQWLHEPRKAFGGVSYQGKLNSLPDDRSRYLFEMDRSARRVIHDMRTWNYNAGNSFECKYEELIEDSGMALVTALLRHLGFEGDEVETGKKVFWDNSLFGELAGANSDHIRSGAGGQWSKVFDASLASAFLERFGDILVQLGYERDDKWASSCPPAVDLTPQAEGAGT